MFLRSEKGQSLVELVIGIAVGLLFITGAIGIITLSLRVDTQNKSTYGGAELAQELLEQVATTANNNWHAIFDGTHGTSTLYHIATTSESFIERADGSETITVSDVTYSRYFTVEDVYRDENDAVVDTAGTLDPSTLKITATVNWTERGEQTTTSLSRYITRIRNREAVQTNWVNGTSSDAVALTSFNSTFATSTNIKYASSGYITIVDLSSELSSSSVTNIDLTDKWAWSDVFGWIDFRSYTNVFVSSTQMTGYVDTDAGVLALDCATTPNGDICGTSSFGIINDGTGALSGMAWNDTVGWISFSCVTTGTCGTYNYGVSVDASGYFSGWAWGDTTGWISFNCSNTATCGTVDYKLKTTWGTPVATGSLISRTFDTEVEGGAAFNTVMWQGTLPTGTNVEIQIATSNCENGATNAPTCDENVGWGGDKIDGDGAFVGYDGSASTRYELVPDIQTRVIREYHNNRRYTKYKIYLTSDASLVLSPKVEDVIINWSL
jgi:hypothetical protein